MKNLALGEAFRLVANDKPSPGGGAVAALSCGAAASLACMVASITAGKERYKEWRVEMESIAAEARKYMDELLDLADEDSRSYEAVIAAARMPRTSREEASERQKALGLAYKRATDVPLRVCRASVEILQRCLILARHGIKSASTDVAIASLSARSAFDGSMAVIRVNLPETADGTYMESVKREIEKLNSAKERLANEIASALEGLIGA